MNQSEVTVCFTSSGRWDLLRITIESFLKHNTYDIKEFFIHDDSGYVTEVRNDKDWPHIPLDLQDDFPFIQWPKPMERIINDQIKSLDYLWWLCQTEYAFFGEDDWLFTRPGFIEDSMAVMETDPKILMCWLKGLEPKNTHPIMWKTGGHGIFKTSPTLWAWHRFNPSLKRKADYDLIAPFSKYTTFDKNKGWKSEAAISQVYNKLGFTAAMLPHEYIKHLGEGRRCV